MSAHERERLCGYLDDELAAAERAEVAAHLAACAECRERLAALSAVDEMAATGGRTSGLPAQAPEGYFDDFARRVRSRLEAEAAPEPRGRAGRRADDAARPRRLPAWSWAVAAALLLAVVTPLTLRERAGHPTEARGAREAPPAESAATRPTPTRPVAPTPATTTLPEPAAPAAAPAAPPAAPPAAAPGAGRAGAAAISASRPAFAAPPAAAPAAASSEAKPVLREARDEAGPPPRQKQSPMAAAPPTGTSAGALAAPPARVEALPPEAAAVAAEAAQGRSEEAVNRTAVLGAALQDDSEREFRLLAAQSAGGLDDWRARREHWRAFAAAHPDSPRADEARVQVIAAGLAAVRAGGGGGDRARLEQDAAQYLARADARQRPRVRALLDEAARR